MTPIKWNEWRSLTLVEELLTVSVVIPAKDNQAQLELCLAALTEQDYPSEKMTVIVVDHGSEVPLVIPTWAPSNVTFLRHDGGSGPGAARAEGARFAMGDVLLFIDSDIIASNSMVRNFTRWHTVAETAVVLGFRDFINPVGISVDEIRESMSDGRLSEYLQSRTGEEGQQWIDDYLRTSSENTMNREDLWTIVVGAGLAIRRDFYDYIGGFRDFRVHGIEDTEFGFRAFHGGGVIIPDRDCHGYHLGLRSISKNRERIKRDRFALLANVIADDRTRPPLGNALWEVPKVHSQVVIGDDDDFSMVRSTVDDLLSSNFTDLHIEVVCNHDVLSVEIDEYYASNSRISISTGQPHSGFPAPFTMRVAAGTRFTAESLALMVSNGLKDPQGVVAYVAESENVSVEFWRTRALCRASFSAAVQGSQEARDYIRECFGEIWKPAASVGVSMQTGVSDFRVKSGRYVMGTSS